MDERLEQDQELGGDAVGVDEDAFVPEANDTQAAGLDDACSLGVGRLRWEAVVSAQKKSV